MVIIENVAYALYLMIEGILKMWKLSRLILSWKDGLQKTYFPVICIPIRVKKNYDDFDALNYDRCGHICDPACSIGVS